ncbi:MAG: TetR/AcrR family transcriptional regulator [Nannocystis sp.]|nr:TetR/AcrR family transcriptional regulator [Nannocystis sp.]
MIDEADEPDDPRSQRILAAAVALAERGGFAEVRLRDVAEGSGVALGTLYKRFRSKEDLLVAVLGHQLGELRARLEARPLGGDRRARLREIFGELTRFLCERPHLGRAVIRSAAAGDAALATRLAHFHGALGELVLRALYRGQAGHARHAEIAMVSALQRVWFALLVGWASGLHGEREVLEGVDAAAALMLEGVDAAQLLAPQT